MFVLLMLTAKNTPITQTGGHPSLDLLQCASELSPKRFDPIRSPHGINLVYIVCVSAYYVFTYTFREGERERDAGDKLFV
jgi:hypothetical protein